MLTFTMGFGVLNLRHGHGRKLRNSFGEHWVCICNLMVLFYASIASGYQAYRDLLCILDLSFLVYWLSSLI